MSKDDILAAISILSDAIGFCQHENRTVQSDGLSILIDQMVQLRGQLQRMLQETKSIEIIINCVHCEYVHHQAKGYMVFSVACNDYQGLQCPQCHQSNWNVTARIAQQGESSGK